MQIAVLPIRIFMASVLPKTEYSVFGAITGFYKLRLSFLCSLIIFLTTQLMGYGWAGMLRRYANVAQVSLFRALHQKDPKSQGYTRMKFFLIVFSASFFLIGSSIAQVDDVKLVNVSNLEMFVDKLPEIPKLYGYRFVDGVPVSRTLKIGMFKKKWKFHKQIPSTHVYAYGTSPRAATVPGPTLEAIHGIPIRVKWSNHLPPKHILPWDPTIPTAIPQKKSGIPTVVHLHGGIHGSESDGNAHAWFTRRFIERGPKWSTSTYEYLNNQQPGTMWYHDHAMGLTRVNLLAGLVGAYVLRDHGFYDLDNVKSDAYFELLFELFTFV